MKNFKDFSISRKLTTGFSALVLVMLIVGSVGIFGMVRINNSDTYLYEKQTAPFNNLIQAMTALNELRVDVRNATALAGNSVEIEKIKQRNASNESIFLEQMQLYRPSITNSSSITAYDKMIEIFNNTYIPVVQQVVVLAGENKPSEATAAINNATAKVTEMQTCFDTLTDNRMESAKKTSDTNETTAFILITILGIIILLGAIFSFILSRKISKSISTPIGRVVDASELLALGHVDIDLSDLDSKDETGILAASFTKMLDGIRKQVIVAEQISNGDFTQSVPLRSNEDTLGLALQKIKNDLNETLQLIRTAADQVNSGAGQVAAAAQALSSGATEQAATVEELNASIASVSQQAELNTTSVHNAVEYVGQAGQEISSSNEFMKRLNVSMREIGESSQQISKITKLVEDIAFQTNILALNAAVEAARAGNAGKGFAVVADEVRTLAARSAEAAKQTSELIEKSVTIVSQGEQLAEDTLKRLISASEKADLAVQSIQEIENATTEQAASVEQINEGLNQVSAVVQTNAATAEESSASSEELAAQAQTLQQEVSRFKLMDTYGYSEFSYKEEKSSALHVSNGVSYGSIHGSGKY
ncbi:methyl-accepting chemotaxis protein [Anaerotignum propionicum]|uniref:methyl-accepting chemotaxis protein n=1 Tax=Anaerotignum propionicum TaxID=28446 RepID=UPI0021093EAA|nr:methyl-accepting chemotaxis protein [Anaerotignum propionicum]MCQ4937298.1 methyl-accepting chemotaxis protein [Anaerotignum propionicum]